MLTIILIVIFIVFFIILFGIISLLIYRFKHNKIHGNGLYTQVQTPQVQTPQVSPMLNIQSKTTITDFISDNIKKMEKEINNMIDDHKKKTPKSTKNYKKEISNKNIIENGKYYSFINVNGEQNEKSCEWDINNGIANITECEY